MKGIGSISDEPVGSTQQDENALKIELLEGELQRALQTNRDMRPLLKKEARRVNYLASLMSAFVSKETLTLEERKGALKELERVLSGEMEISPLLFPDDGSTAYAAIERAEKALNEQS